MVRQGGEALSRVTKTEAQLLLPKKFIEGRFSSPIVSFCAGDVGGGALFTAFNGAVPVSSQSRLNWCVPVVAGSSCG